MATIPTTKYSPLDIEQLPMLDLLSNIGNAIKADADINAWCRTIFAQELYVFSGSDPENPPGAAQYPMVEIFPLADNHGINIEQHEVEIGLVCGVYDEELQPVIYNNYEMQRGLLRLEQLYSRILQVIPTSDLAGGYLAETGAQRDDEIIHPYFVLGAHLKIIKPL